MIVNGSMVIGLCQGVICPDNWNGLLLLNVSGHQLLQPFHVKLADHAALLPGHLPAPKEFFGFETLKQFQLYTALPELK